jgi:hypothetical protein
MLLHGTRRASRTFRDLKDPSSVIPPSSFISRNLQHQRIFSSKAAPILSTLFLRPVTFSSSRNQYHRQFSISQTTQIVDKPLKLRMADYEAVLKGKYPAKAHAKKVIEWMKKKDPSVNGVLYLEGQKTSMIEDNDSEAHFRYLPHLLSLHTS